jgi:hypothetical protein
MGLLRIALGYRTAHRRSLPEVLAIALENDTIQKAIDAAGAEFQRIEVGAFHYIKPGKRSKGTTKGAKDAKGSLQTTEGTENTEEISKLTASPKEEAPAGDESAGASDSPAEAVEEEAPVANAPGRGRKKKKAGDEGQPDLSGETE